MKYTFKSEVWIYPGMQGHWHFASVPKKMSETITKNRKGMKRKGWGSVPVVVTLGKTSWQTSIFPDKREEAYILPLKAEVRKKEGIRQGDKVTFIIEIVSGK